MGGNIEEFSTLSVNLVGGRSLSMQSYLW